MVRRRIIRGAVGVIAGLGVLAGCTPSPHVNAPIGSSSTQPDAPADLSAGRSEPVADPLYPDYGNPDVDVLHYGLALGYDPSTRVLSGTATITLRAVKALNGLRLDFADNLKVGEASLDGTAVTATQSGHDVTFGTSLAAETQAVLTVTYEGVPEQAPAPTTRGDFEDGLGMRPESDGSLWTMQEPYGAFTWYPDNDHPSDEALYDLTVTVPDGWSGVASGSFMGQTASGDESVFTWHSADPVASYLTTLAVDEFEKIEMTGPGDLPITAWIPRESMREFERPLRQMPEHIDYIAERYGPYPFDAAGVVLVGGESAMETQEMITFSSALGSMGPDMIESVMVHELAHQWFGDAVTPVDWRGVWLNESMATYIED
ncbi:MAG TPA: M1 family aminopeptidase, partial [Phytomonospora sp.]